MQAHASASFEAEFLPIAPKPIPLRNLLLIAAIFWVYVTLSNVLYANSMQINTTQVTHKVLFAPAGLRVMQHALLFPLLLGCFWVSSRVGWAPLRGLPVQIFLGVVFAIVSFPAMDVADVLSLRLHLQPTEYSGAMGNQPKMNLHALWNASFVNFLLTYSFGVALVSGFGLYQRFRDSELRGAALEQGWTAARLSALRMQLSPHTLFNLLHTIRGQINPEPEIARSMVMQLADLLRRLLSAGQRDFSLLSEELTFARLYLELQQQRFTDRLTVCLPDIAAHDTLWVPSLILQPLVENAVLHGLTGHEGPVTVRIEVIPAADTLVLRVVNTIASPGREGSEGIGLSNVRERLGVQFGAQATLDARAADASTWVAEISMPALREIVPQPAPANH